MPNPTTGAPQTDPCRYQYGYKWGGSKGPKGDPVPDGTPINVLPNTLDPSALKYQAAFVPKPNLAGLVNNYVSNDPLISSQTLSIGRLDWQIKNNLSAFVRYAYYENITNNQGSYGGLLNGASIRNDDLRNQDVTIGITQVVSATMLNDIRVALGRSYFPFTAGTVGQNWPQQLGMGGTVPSTAIPIVSVSGYGLTTTANLGKRTSTVPEINDTVTILHGPHSLHIGAGVRGYESYNNSNTYPSGQFSFATTTTADAGSMSTTTGNAYATFLLGEAASITAQAAAGSTARIFSVNGYVQDDWRATSNLTLNLGLRYDYQSIPWEKANGFSTLKLNQINPINGLVGKEVYASPSARNFASENYYNFAPRVGFAWLLSQSHHSVIRGGYAIYYAAASNTVYSNATDGFSTNTTTYVSTTTQGYIGLFSQGLPSAPLGLPGAAGGPNMLLGQSPTVQPQSAKTSATQQYNIAFDHTFPKKTVMSIFFLGSHGTNFPMTGLNLNQLNPIYFGLGNALQNSTNNPYYGIVPASVAALGGKTIQEEQALKPYPYFQQVYLYYPHIGSFWGKALQVVFIRPIYTGLQMQIGYNLANLQADPLTSAVTASPTVSAALQNNYAPHSEYGVDPTDVKHRISGNMTYTLPFGKGQAYLAHASDRVQKWVSGWNLAGTVIGETGRPLQITGGNGTVSTRPSYTGTSPHLAHPSQAAWFNTQAFQIAAPWTFGNVPRTLAHLRGPGDFSLNMNLTKTTTFGKYQLQLQASAYNALNKTNYSSPNTNLPVTQTTATLNSPFGTITSASQARTIQLQARFRF